MRPSSLSQDTSPGWRVKGHDVQVGILSKSLERPAHAYLFLGPKGVGKKTLAVEFAKSLNCEAESSAGPCQSCSHCRLIGNMVHPDVSYLAPVEKASVSIDQVRQLRQELAILPNQGRWRVAIIQADLLTEPAADALLKTLEEPNDRVVLLLLGGNELTIPETIVSRCRIVQLALVSRDTIAEELRLRGVPVDEAAELARSSYGSIGWAITASLEPDEVSRRKSIQEDLDKWASSSLLERLAAADSVAAAGKPDKVRILAMEELEMMVIWWRDILLACAGEPDLMIGAAQPDHAEGQTAVAALRAIREIAKTATRIRENADTRLALEALGTAI